MNHNVTNSAAPGQPFPDAQWRKSSYSGGQGNCVEVGQDVSRVVPVRDSKAPSGPLLVFDPETWATFVEQLKA